MPTPAIILGRADGAFASTLSGSEPWCGIQIIDLANGDCADWFRIDGAAVELYDLEVLTGHPCPMSLSLTSPQLADFMTYEGMNRTGET